MRFLRVIRGAVAIVAPTSCEVCTAVQVTHKPRRRCCDFFVSCFLTATLYFFTYLFFSFPLIVECGLDASVEAED